MRTGAIIGAVSGDLMGINFSNQGGSTVIRKKRRRQNLASTANKKNQNNLMRVRNAWADLTEDQKNAWRQAASNLNFSNRLGVRRSLSGFIYYMKFNLNFIQVGGAPLDLPTRPNAVAFSGVPSVTSSIANGITFTLPDGTSPPQVAMRIYGRNMWRDTSIRFSNQSTFVSFQQDSAASGFEITGDWSQILGLPILNQFIYLRFVFLDIAVFQPVATYTQFVQTGA